MAKPLVPTGGNFYCCGHGCGSRGDAYRRFVINRLIMYGRYFDSKVSMQRTREDAGRFYREYEEPCEEACRRWASSHYRPIRYNEMKWSDIEMHLWDMRRFAGRGGPVPEPPPGTPRKKHKRSGKTVFR